MTRNIFLGSIVICLLLFGLTQVSDPSIFGIHDEPGRIMFYGGSGLLAGLFGLIALGSGVYLGVTHGAGISKSQRRLLWVLALIVLIVILTTSVIRFVPAK